VRADCPELLPPPHGLALTAASKSSAIRIAKMKIRAFCTQIAVLLDRWMQLEVRSIINYAG
jgi:hypothetical protein